MKNKITKKKVKELLIQYLNSTEKEIIFVYDNSFFVSNDGNFIESIKMHDFVNYYLTEFGYCYDIDEIKDVYELIEIFLTIYYFNKSIFEKYKKFYLKYKLDLSINQIRVYFKCYEIDKKIFNIINKFLSDLSIEIIKNKNHVKLDFSNALFLNKKDPIQKIITKYLKIKNNRDESAIEEKNTYLSALKNELDDLVKKGDIQNEYLKLDTKNFRTTMQSLFSHRGSNNKNNPKFEKIKEKYEESNDKNKMINEIFDALVLMYMYKKILN